MLKKIISIGILVIVTIALTGCSVKTANQNTPAAASNSSSPTTSINTPINETSIGVRLPYYSSDKSSKATFTLVAKDIPVLKTCMVYKVKKPDVNAESVQKIGAKLGFTGGTGLIDQDTKYAMLDEKKEEVRQLYVMINSGAIEYVIVFPDKLSPKVPPALPSQEDATKIAIDFLTRTGLLPDTDLVNESVTNDAKSGGTYNMARKAEKGSGPVEVISSYDTHILVNFLRQINGIPVAKSGGNQLAVRIGDKGEVFRVIKVWREVEPYLEYPVKSVQQAFDLLVNGKGSGRIPSGCSEIAIDKVTLAYWMESQDYSQEFVFPVYEFSGTCRAANGDILENYLGWTEALQ